MNLGRQSISATEPLVLHDLRLDASSDVFSLSSPHGWAVHRASPPELVRKRPVLGGTLSIVQPLHASSLVFDAMNLEMMSQRPIRALAFEDR